MNNDFPPKQLAQPTIKPRKPGKGQSVPLAQEVLARRSEIARILGTKVEAINKHLKSLTEEERRAVFYKVTHDGPVSLSGTGLKPLVDRSDSVTLAVPTAENLDSFAAKVTEFETSVPKNGMVKNQSFANIEDLVPGDPKDRLSDELLSAYATLIQRPFVICEVELISLAGRRDQRREEIATILTDLNNAFANGIHGTLFEHEERDRICRAVIRCTGRMFQRLVEETEWQRKISWFEPKPQFETFHTIWNNFEFDKLGPTTPPSNDAPVVCIIDSGVTPGNPFLKPVTKTDLLKSFLKHEPDNPNDGNGHGSGVASLAAYYGLNLDEGAENVARVWIAGARILGDDNQIEEERLLSRLIEEVVDVFVPLGVRIFNLSVGDLAKKWNQDSRRTQPRTSWTARTLDRLSRGHDIVFVVSTGNIHPNTIRDYLRDGIPYPVYLCNSDSRILDPGQAALAISVGSITAGTAVAHSPNTALAMDYEPSPFTRSGPGIKGETKPDLVEFGGNLVTDVDHTTVQGNASTNVVMASNKLSPAAAHKFGTSFAAPRVTHKLAVLLRELQQLGLEYISAPLLKAFLLNSAVYRGDLRNVVDQLNAVAKKQWLNVLGNGWPDTARATECDDYSILLFHQGDLAVDQVAFFDVPIPAKLSETSSGKRITVTVVHDPEVQRWGLESYFGIDLKWRMFRGDIDRERILEQMSGSEETADSDQDVTAEDPDTEPDGASDLMFEHKVTRRSRGSVQHDWLDWKQHKAEFSESHYTLAITATTRWGRNPQPTKFAVVVRIEDLGGTIPVYAEVAAQLDVLVEQSA
jgi:hypothetical protein